MAGIKDEVLEALDRFHAAQQARDTDAVVAAHATNGFVSRSDARARFERLLEDGGLNDRVADLSACRVFTFRDSALAKPVIYRTPSGTSAASFHLDRQPGGSWLIVDHRRSRLPSEAVYSPDFVANAARLVGARGMLWIRRLDVPVDVAWRAISTREGLERWWLTRSVRIDLRPGGRFEHHWMNTVRDFEVHRFIAFAGAPDDAAGSDDVMRFELKPDGTGCVFSFFDAFHAHPRPLSLPWTAAGWHLTVDALEEALTGRARGNDFGFGGDFYWDYLRDQHALAERARGLPPAAIDDREWRSAYLAPPL